MSERDENEYVPPAPKVVSAARPQEEVADGIGHAHYDLTQIGGG